MHVNFFFLHKEIYLAAPTLKIAAKLVIKP
jgi:hypothetical protein